MHTVQEFQAAFAALPVAQRFEVLDALEASVVGDSLPIDREHLRICEERWAEFEAGGMKDGIPFDVAMARLFPKS